MRKIPSKKTIKKENLEIIRIDAEKNSIYFLNKYNNPLMTWGFGKIKRWWEFWK